uniref:Uncharacterized protein n=1 Tax=Taiwanofungus camphoratus TaxID=2696576 RepID=A0A4D6SST9_TAICA|nr:hypothetical protein [Taiwanofungus camphoratus]QCG70017.1 hypothetical protein [Taiwanofungus camphoratus]UKQ56123.1 hypothetical protein [Taiwanofungus camphoratus]WRO45218.1 hypothetical protein [Taiwanofungus sp. YW-2023a]
MRNFLLKYLSINIDKNSIYLALKKGYSVPILPEKVDKIYNNIYIRILRFIGGLCLLLVLTSSYLLSPAYLHKLIIIIGAIQSVQMFILFIVKFIYGIYTLIYKSKEFEVRNSPLNKFASHIGKIIYCAKVGCTVTGGAVTFLGGGAVYDEILVQAGRDRQFIPFMGSLYKSVFGEITPANQERLNAMVTKSKANSDDKAPVT